MDRSGSVTPQWSGFLVVISRFRGSGACCVESRSRSTTSHVPPPSGWRAPGPGCSTVNGDGAGITCRLVERQAGSQGRGGWVSVQVGVHSVSPVAFAQPAWGDTPSRGRTPAVDDPRWRTPAVDDAGRGPAPGSRASPRQTSPIRPGGSRRPAPAGSRVFNGQLHNRLPGSGKHEWITEVAPVNASGSPLGGHRCDHRTVVAVGSARLGG
jgi:hypothetical protein